MPRAEERWVAYLTGKIAREGEWYVARCDSLPVVTQGKSDGEAIANLIEATQMFIESCIERGTHEEVLLKYHCRPSVQPPQDLVPPSFAIPVPLPQVVKRQLEACPT